MFGKIQSKMKQIKYVKETNSLDLNIEKTNRGKIIKEVELDCDKIDSSLEDYQEKCISQNNLKIAPTFIPDRRIKKPEGKEPSLFKLISSKITGIGSSSKSKLQKQKKN